MKADTFLKDRLDFHSEHSGQLAAFIHQNHSVTYSELKFKVELLKKQFLENELNHSGPVLVNLPMGIDLAVMMTALLSEGIPALVVPTGTKTVEVLKMAENFPFQALIDQKITRLNPGDQEVVNFSWLLYTSGSTGIPKMVMISAQSLKERTLGEIDLFGLKEHSKILNLLPFSHDLGLNQLLTSVYSGSCLEIVVNILPVELAKTLSTKSYNSITGMPQIWNNFIQVASKLNLSIDHPGVLTISGGSMTTQNLLKLKNVFKNKTLIKTYGQTETFRSLAEKNQDEVLNDSCGSEIPGVKVKLLNESGHECSVGETGELVHSGSGAMMGYWKNESSVNLSSIRTGDFFTRISETTYRYVGRNDDMIKHTGRRFFLGEVENCLLKSELIHDACVIQAEDNRVFSGNDRLVGFVIPKSNQETLSKELKTFCAQHLESYKVPDEFIICESFPMTSSQKIDRRELKKKL